MGRLDEFQDKAADIARNAVVSAGAGSGKTTVLAERAVRLVTGRGIKVEEMLVLTFTRKATVEMKGRIFGALKAAADAGNEKALAAVRSFDKAHIQTLDSYCAEIARQGAHLYGITPGFTQDKDKAEEAVRARALPFLLKHRDDAAIQSLTRTMDDFDRIADELLVNPMLDHSTVAEPIDFLGDLDAQAAELPSAWAKAVSEAEATVAEISRLYGGMGGKGTNFTKALGKALDSHTAEPPVLTKEAVRAADDSALVKYLVSLGEFCKIGRLPGKVSGETAALKELAKLLFEQIDTLLSIASAVEGFPVAESAARLLSDFQDEVNRQKRTSGILTFKDISDLALRTLRERPEIRALEKRKFRAIMIDEFQDNNELQRDLLFMLAEKPGRMEKGVPSADEISGDRLFFVGDEKQSIYKFRGADVSVFRGLKETMRGEDGGGNLELRTNYRSRPELIAAFNTLFGGFPYPPAPGAERTGPAIFRAGGDKDAKPHEAVYSEVLCPKSKAAEFDAGRRRVHVALFRDENPRGEKDGESLGAAESEAAFVAAEIRRLVDSGRCSAGDVAILLKSTTRQPVFERMLLAQGIPYSTEIFKGFFSDGPVNDIAAYLSLCAYPDDDNAYLTLLCSPFVNLPPEDAHEVVASRRRAWLEEISAAENGADADEGADGKEPPRAKPAPFSEEQAATLPEPSRERFLRAGEGFRATAEEARHGAARAVSRLWYSLGYRYETEWNRTVDMYATLYDLLFELARKADSQAQSLAEFVDSLREYRDERQRVEDLDIPLEARDCVKIMTIHKSKGLEFPVVFVSSISGSGNGDKNSEPLFISRRFGAVVNTPKGRVFSLVESRGRNKDRNTVSYFYDIEKAENDEKAGAELRRLTYVAFTRAEEELYLTGSYNGRPELADSKTDASAFLPDAAEPRKIPTKIYHVLQPLLARYVADGPTAAADSPFDFTEIPATSRGEAAGVGRTRTRANTAEAKAELTERLSAEYAAAEIEETDAVPSPYVAPTRLRAESATPPRKTGGEPPDLFPEIDALLGGENGEDEDEGGPGKAFGNIAHAYVESLFTGERPKFGKEDADEFTDEQLGRAEEICARLRDSFAATALGRRSLASSWRRTEFAFRSRIGTKAGEKILRGRMDLVFREEDGSYTIVDHKSGRTRNPAAHAVQLACYRSALAEILGVEKARISCHVFHLRFASDDDITKICEKISEETLDTIQ